MKRVALGGMAIAIMGLGGALRAASPPAGFYRLQSAVTLPGRSPDWDYLAYDPARARLFIARRHAGLWVFDTRRQRLVTRIADSAGAGATLLIPAIGRGFATNEDGSTTVFDLATLRTIRRIKFADDADAASYDPVTGRIAFVSADSRIVTLFDARRLVPVATVHLATRKADASVGDGAGHILLNERDRAMIAKIDAASGSVLSEWPVTGCTQPTGLAVDPAHRRAFIGCRGDKPVLAVLDTTSGAVVQTLPLGHGNDGVVYDSARRRVVTTNGIEANIVVYRQDDADHYHLDQAVATRPEARTMAYDPQSARIFTVTAEGVVNPAAPVNTGPSAFYPNAYYDGSFTVLTYGPSR